MADKSSIVMKSGSENLKLNIQNIEKPKTQTQCLMPDKKPQMNITRKVIPEFDF